MIAWLKRLLFGEQKTSTPTNQPNVYCNSCEMSHRRTKEDVGTPWRCPVCGSDNLGPIPRQQKIVTIFAPPSFFRAAQVNHGGFDTMEGE